MKPGLAILLAADRGGAGVARLAATRRLAGGRAGELRDRPAMGARELRARGASGAGHAAPQGPPDRRPGRQRPALRPAPGHHQLAAPRGRVSGFAKPPSGGSRAAADPARDGAVRPRPGAALDARPPGGRAGQPGALCPPDGAAGGALRRDRRGAAADRRAHDVFRHRDPWPAPAGRQQCRLAGLPRVCRLRGRPPRGAAAPSPRARRSGGHQPHARGAHRRPHGGRRLSGAGGELRELRRRPGAAADRPPCDRRAGHRQRARSAPARRLADPRPARRSARGGVQPDRARCHLAALSPPVPGQPGLRSRPRRGLARRQLLPAAPQRVSAPPARGRRGRPGGLRRRHRALGPAAFSPGSRRASAASCAPYSWRSQFTR